MEQNHSQSPEDLAKAVVPGRFKTYLKLLLGSLVSFVKLTFIWKVPPELARGKENVRGAFWLVFWYQGIALLSLFRALGSLFVVLMAIAILLSSPIACLFMVPYARKESTRLIKEALEKNSAAG